MIAGILCFIAGYAFGNFVPIESGLPSGNGENEDPVAAHDANEPAPPNSLIPIEELDKALEDSNTDNLDSILRDPQDISILELRDIIETNVAIAEDDYVGKSYRVRADLKHMLGDIGGSYVISVLPTGTDQRLSPIDTSLSFPNLPRDIQRSFRRGQSISAVCILKGVERGNIYFGPCRLD